WKWREVLRLRARKEPWPYERIARRYGVKPVTARCWVHRAERFLQGLPPSVLRRPSGYAVVRRGRGYAVILRHPPERRRGSPSPVWALETQFAIR
ncbi:MAG: hypothetical protein ACREIU_11310, partial [Planctomycetota bacterium]